VDEVGGAESMAWSAEWWAWSEGGDERRGIPLRAELMAWSSEWMARKANWWRGVRVERRGYP